MKKFILTLIFLLTTSTVSAAENPSCVLMKFTDDTRFDLVDSATSLSDLVMEKLIASKKFRLMEQTPIQEDIEIKLYDEKLRDLKFLEDAIKKAETPIEILTVENSQNDTSENANVYETAKVEQAENLNVDENKTSEQNADEPIDEIKTIEKRVIDLTPLFEGVGFDENRAQSIATAQVGQIIDPVITSEIGKMHNAEYLIQGTIINLGTGTWWSENFEQISNVMNTFSELANTSVPMGMLGDVLSGVDVGKIGVGVQCDLRVIKAETGKVVWSKRVVGIQDQVNLNLGTTSIGSRKLNNNFYAKAMDKAAQKIVDALVSDYKNIFR